MVCLQVAEKEHMIYSISTWVAFPSLHIELSLTYGSIALFMRRHLGREQVAAL